MTAESVATIPVIINSNFTEPEPLGLHYKSHTTSQEQIQSDHASYLKSESPRYRKASTDTKSDESEDDFPPMIELVTEHWTWVLYHEEVQQRMIMTTIVFHKTIIGFGTNAANNKGVWFKGCIQDIVGVEGAYSDSYHSNRKYLKFFLYIFNLLLNLLEYLADLYCLIDITFHYKVESVH